MTVRRSTQELTFNDTIEQFVENAAVFYNHQVTEEECQRKCLHLAL